MEAERIAGARFENLAAAFASRLQAALAPHRLWHDGLEYLVLEVSGAMDEDRAQAMAMRIRDVIRRSSPELAQSSVHCGFSQNQVAGDNAQQVFAEAFQALYWANHGSHDLYSVYDERVWGPAADR
jgi:GGDEF domain-containing protein